MKIERTKNAGRNIFFGVILKIFQIIVPFLMRTAMIYFLGIEYLGLNSLFASVLQVLNLAELGVGSAMVYSMYKPIADGDEDRICALMRLYKIYYRVIGTIIGIIGIIITPVVPRLIKGDVPKNINIYILYFFNLAATVLSYWLFAYKSAIIQAHQRNDIISKIALITSTIQYCLQLLVLWAFRDYYFYILVILLTQALTNIFIGMIATKIYPRYNPKGMLSPEERKCFNGRIKDLFTARLGSVIVGSVDTIVISAYLGLTELAIYQNYYFILNSIYGLIIVIFNSVTAGIGNSLVTETNEKNYSDFSVFSFLSCWLITICVCCFIALYQPFMELWVGIELMLDDSFVILFCIYFYVMTLAMVWATVKDAAGIWHSDRFRPLIGASVNLCMNLIFVNYIGLYGIVLSTILSYIFISMPWLLVNLFKHVYRVRVVGYLINMIKSSICCIIACILTKVMCSTIRLNGIIGLIMYGAVAVLISNAVVWIIYRNNDEYKKSMQLIRKMVKISNG